MLKQWKRQINVCKREAAAQGLKHSHTSPVVTWEKEQHSAGDKWEESAASVIQDISVKNTKHSRSGVVCEICLLQKKVNTDEDGDRGAAQYRGISGSTVSARTIWQGPVRGGFIKSRQIDSKSPGKLKNFFQANNVIVISEAILRTLVLLLYSWTKSNSKTLFQQCNRC